MLQRQESISACQCMRCDRKENTFFCSKFLARLSHRKKNVIRTKNVLKSFLMKNISLNRKKKNLTLEFKRAYPAHRRELSLYIHVGVYLDSFSNQLFESHMKGFFSPKSLALFFLIFGFISNGTTQRINCFLANIYLFKAIDVVLMFLLLTLNKFHTFFQRFYC